MLDVSMRGFGGVARLQSNASLDVQRFGTPGMPALIAFDIADSGHGIAA
jgi:hypothetical protein